jgi:hypothetical protein
MHWIYYSKASEADVMGIEQHRSFSRDKQYMPDRLLSEDIEAILIVDDKCHTAA